MLLEALSSAILGLALAWAATRRLPHRFPARALVLPGDRAQVRARSVTVALHLVRELLQP